MTAPHLRIHSIELFERHVALRIPFKFGANTLTEAPQVFVRVEIDIDGRRGTGQSAELLAPKWFDKNPALGNAENFDQLRHSLRNAARIYLAHGEAAPAFAHHAAALPEHYRTANADGLNDLIASYGMALIDRAILDALCRLAGVSVFAAMRTNLAGLTTALTPDLATNDLDAFLSARRAQPTIAARHTVGMTDPLTDADIAEPLNDGLPQSLEAVIATYGNRYFKLKVGADVDADIERLAAVAKVLDAADAPYQVSLDGNEQFADAAGVVTLAERIAATPALERLWSSTLFIEQPIARDRALSETVSAIAAHKPVVLDESDSAPDVFLAARDLGYAGISAKTCKGVYRALLNAARASAWNAGSSPGRYFVTAEDLTTQAGIAVQQSLALASLVGASHIELNGHHYVGGMVGAPLAEQLRFAAAHPDLYLADDGARLRIDKGIVAIGSLDCPGFAVRTEPDWSTMQAAD